MNCGLFGAGLRERWAGVHVQLNLCEWWVGRLTHACAAQHAVKLCVHPHELLSTLVEVEQVDLVQPSSPLPFPKPGAHVGVCWSSIYLPLKKSLIKSVVWSVKVVNHCFTRSGWMSLFIPESNILVTVCIKHYGHIKCISTRWLLEVQITKREKEKGIFNLTMSC